MTSGLLIDERVSRPATVMLPYRPESAGKARRMVREKLEEWGLLDLVDAAEPIISELVANAVRTGCLTRMTVTIRRVTDRTVRLAVRDGARALPVVMVAREDEECHRGMALIDQLTGGRWGATVEAFGKTVHADLVVPRS
ncbi:hypothetical protein BG452_38275 [Streptomyces sp. CBMA123]|nr:hypothetical protein [Streptomyces sp. CBMA123]